MRRAGKLVFVIALGVVLLSVWVGIESPASAPVETIEGDIRTVGPVDDDGRRHGWYKIYAGDRLHLEVEYEHGNQIEVLEYNPDGTIKSHLRENDNYQLVPVTK